MIQLKISRANSIHGSWKCEEIGERKMDDPFGSGLSIQYAIEDFLSSYKILNGFIPDYKWI